MTRDEVDYLHEVYTAENLCGEALDRLRADAFAAADLPSYEDCAKILNGDHDEVPLLPEQPPWVGPFAVNRVSLKWVCLLIPMGEGTFETYLFLYGKMLPYFAVFVLLHDRQPNGTHGALI